MALWALAFGCRSNPSADSGLILPMEQASLGGLSSCFQWGAVYLCSVPGPEELELASRRGVELLIDLREAPEGGGELAQLARDFGLDYHSVPIEPEVLDDGQVDTALALLEGAGDHPVLMFCDTGGRAAMIAALFHIEKHPDQLEGAIEDARRAGMKPGVSEAALRRQAARLTAGAQLGATQATWAGPAVGR